MTLSFSLHKTEKFSNSWSLSAFRCSIKSSPACDDYRRLDIKRGHTPEFTAIGHIGKGSCAMHSRTVVPNDEVAGAPFMSVDEFRLRGVLHQLTQEQSPFGHRPINNA